MVLDAAQCQQGAQRAAPGRVVLDGRGQRLGQRGECPVLREQDGRHLVEGGRLCPARRYVTLQGEREVAAVVGPPHRVVQQGAQQGRHRLYGGLGGARGAAPPHHLALRDDVTGPRPRHLLPYGLPGHGPAPTHGVLGLEGRPVRHHLRDGEPGDRGIGSDPQGTTAVSGADRGPGQGPVQIAAAVVLEARDGVRVGDRGAAAVPGPQLHALQHVLPDDGPGPVGGGFVEIQHRQVTTPHGAAGPLLGRQPQRDTAGPHTGRRIGAPEGDGERPAVLGVFGAQQGATQGVVDDVGAGEDATGGEKDRAARGPGVTRAQQCGVGAGR